MYELTNTRGLVGEDDLAGPDVPRGDDVAADAVGLGDAVEDVGAVVGGGHLAVGQGVGVVRDGEPLDRADEVVVVGREHREVALLPCVSNVGTRPFSWRERTFNFRAGVSKR